MNSNKDDYSVGYKKPPKDTQFQPGRSGNPSGRPRQRPTIRSELEEELSAFTTVEEGDNAVEVSKRRAIIKRLVEAAIEGNQRAVSTVINLCSKISDTDDEDENSLEEAEILETYHQNKTEPTRKD